jgi:uroporphyrin-III C-methyltransferase
MNDPRASEPQDGAQEPPAAVETQHGHDAPPAPPVSTGRSMSIVLGLFALLLAFAAAGGAALTWWELGQQRKTANDSVEEIRRTVAASDRRLGEQEERLAELNREADERRRELDGLDAELRDARARLETIAREEAGPERAPTFAELEFLLLLANRELTLANNPRVALAALREADDRIAQLEDPGLAQARAALNDEIAAVEVVASIDLDGIALRIASLSRRVEGLPLRASLAPPPEGRPDDGAEEAGWQRLLGRMRDVGAGLFRIRRTDAPAAPLLSPNESFFLYRNIELDLKSARLAVLTRDLENYVESLASARRAVQAYFETDDEGVQSLLAAIEDLEGREIAPQWPEIRRSLELVRAAGAAD